LVLRAWPVLTQRGGVLVTVKDAARRASARWPFGHPWPRLRAPPGGCLAGTKKRPLSAEPRNTTKWVARTIQARGGR